MGERADFPSPEEVVREIERSLGLNPQAAPIWGYEDPYYPIFPEEAPFLEQRKLASECLAELYFLLDDSDRAPEFRHAPLNSEEVIGVFQSYRVEAGARWEDPASFPDFTLSHLLGATKRQIAWIKELKAFEETEQFNGALVIYRTIRNRIEQALHDDLPS